MKPTPLTVHPSGPSTFHVRAVGLTVGAVALLSDLITKWWALDALVDGHRIDLVGKYLSLRLVYNPGAAFSMGDSATMIVTALAIAVVGVLAYSLWTSVSVNKALALGLVIGGALGNIYDRFFSAPYWGQGHVVDFIDYSGFFVGNVADIWIVLGVIALLLLTMGTHEAAASSDEADASIEGEAVDDYTLLENTRSYDDLERTRDLDDGSNQDPRHA